VIRPLLLLLFMLPLAACKRDDMADQPRFKPLAASAFYRDGASARLPVAHTIDQEGIQAQDPMIWKTIRSAGSGARWQTLTPATTFPFQITRADLDRGQLLFDVNCSPCHGLLGDGEGMVPDRGFTRPPTYHSDRLRGAAPAYFFDVITNGIGAMFPYADRIKEDDRWRIAAYIKALQLSQNASSASLSADDQANMKAAAQPASTGRANP